MIPLAIAIYYIQEDVYIVMLLHIIAIERHKSCCCHGRTSANQNADKSAKRVQNPKPKKKKECRDERKEDRSAAESPSCARKMYLQQMKCPSTKMQNECERNRENDAENGKRMLKQTNE